MEQLVMDKTNLSKIPKRFHCPFHNDKTPSASIKLAASGIYYFKCFACDITEDIVALKVRIDNITVAEAIKHYSPNYDPKSENGEKNMKNSVEYKTLKDITKMYENMGFAIAETNEYIAPQTKNCDLVTLKLVKDGKKEFRMCSQTKSGTWKLSAPEGKLPLFNRTRVKQNQRVLIVEGEKCVREVTKLNQHNLAVTTSPGGANGVAKADWSILKDKDLIIWRDKDKPGLEYQEQVIRNTKDIARSISIINVEDAELKLEEKQDVVDYLKKYGDDLAGKSAGLGLVLGQAKNIEGDSPIHDLFKDIHAGKFKMINFPGMPVLSNTSKALAPCTITTIPAEPGAAKSFFMTQCFWKWANEGKVKVSLLMLEDKTSFHQTRALAQMAGDSRLTDIDYIAQYQEYSLKSLERFKEDLAKFNKILTCPGSTQMSLTEVADWVEKQAEAGVEVIGIDPITAAKATSKPWIEDEIFLFRVKEILERTGARLIITTHPRLGKAGAPSLSGLAGGAAYPRFSQTVIWMENLEAPIETLIYRDGSRDLVEHQRTFHIKKSRSGVGVGRIIASELNPKTLAVEELGMFANSKAAGPLPDYTPHEAPEGYYDVIKPIEPRSDTVFKRETYVKAVAEFEDVAASYTPKQSIVTPPAQVKYTDDEIADFYYPPSNNIKNSVFG